MPDCDRPIRIGFAFDYPGTWKYVFENERVGGFYLLEFSASNAKCKKKHVFQQVDGDTFVLMPVKDAREIYDNPSVWEERGYYHNNWNKIVMQRVQVHGCAQEE